MRFFILLGILFLASCSKEVLNDRPLNYTMMPPYLDVKTVLPEQFQDSIIDTKSKDFVSIPIDSGKLVTIYKDTLHIPSGVLISEKKASLYVFYKSNYEQSLTKIKILDTLNRTYYQKALDAEKIYQSQIKALQQDVKRTWIEKNMAYIGFGSGLITSILTAWVLFHIQ